MKPDEDKQIKSLSEVVLACGTRLVDVPDITQLWAVRGLNISRVSSVEFSVGKPAFGKATPVKFDVPGSTWAEPESVYADKAKAYARALNSLERYAERLRDEAAMQDADRSFREGGAQ
jgi:hypothetical protein